MCFGEYLCTCTKFLVREENYNVDRVLIVCDPGPIYAKHVRYLCEGFLRGENSHRICFVFMFL